MFKPSAEDHHHQARLNNNVQYRKMQKHRRDQPPDLSVAHGHSKDNSFNRDGEPIQQEHARNQNVTSNISGCRLQHQLSQ